MAGSSDDQKSRLLTPVSVPPDSDAAAEVVSDVGAVFVESNDTTVAAAGVVSVGLAL